MPAETTEARHMGRNVKRLMEIMGVKQEALAFELGDDWNQQKVSVLEQKEMIDDGLLEQISKVLKLPVEAIKNFNPDEAIYNIQNNYEGSNTNATNVGPAAYMNYKCNFNPIDKIVQLYDEKIGLYERMLRDKDGMIEQLKKDKK